MPTILPYLDSVNLTIAESEMNGVCPLAPEPEYEVTNDGHIRFTWDTVENSQGYRMLSTALLGYEALQETDLGNVLTTAFPYEPGNEYSFAFLAFNAECSSELSEIISVNL